MPRPRKSADEKKRGRPRKVFSQDASKDAEFHKSHSCWDFTDFVVPYQPMMHYRDAGDLNGPAVERMAFWTGLGDSLKTLEIAFEICPDTGRSHGQGRVRFVRKIRFEALKKILPPDVHFEPSACQTCDMYLRKHDSITLVKIDNRHQGRRNVFREQHTAIIDGANVRECCLMDGANLQSVRNAECLMKYIEPLRPEAPREVIYVTSVSEVPTDAYRIEDRFWDGYDAHESIYVCQPLLNFDVHQLSRITGKYPFRTPKGRSARYNKVYIFGISEDMVLYDL